VFVAVLDELAMIANCGSDGVESLWSLSGGVKCVCGRRRRIRLIIELSRVGALLAKAAICRHPQGEGEPLHSGERRPDLRTLKSLDLNKSNLVELPRGKPTLPLSFGIRC